MKNIFAMLIVSILLVTAVGFSAVKTNTVSVDKKEVICPVTGTKITPATATDKMVYKGKTYFFCCSGCKPMFKKNPEKYIKSMKNTKNDMKGMKM